MTAMVWLGLSLTFPAARQADARSMDSQTASRAAPDREAQRRLRREVALQLRATQRPGAAGAEAHVRRLIELYRQIDAARLPDADRNKLGQQVAARLVDYAGVLERAAASERVSRQRRRDGSSGGGAVPASARELIDLIRSTVAPESWDVAGGRGTIRYYSRNPALVIRQSAQVHEQIGGMLRQARH